VGKLTIIYRILQISHIDYVSCWVPSQSHFDRFENILRTFLWSKYGGDHALEMVSWDVGNFPNEEGGSGLIDVVS